MDKLLGFGVVVLMLTAIIVKLETGVSVAVWVHRFFGGN
jgi:hypothetical protein